MAEEESSVQSSEAGHQGHDRQPGKDVKQAAAPTPGLQGETPAANEVQGRSEEAANKPGAERRDTLRPGPREDKSRKEQYGSGGANKGDER